MADNHKIVVKQPAVFKLNSSDEFSIWYAQFINYAEAVGIEKANTFVALKSFLDASAFSIVENLEVSDENKADPAKFKSTLEEALSRKDKIPPRLALRYRSQETDESLADFALALEKLANKAGVHKDARPQLLVDSFCTGVRDTDLSIKLLETHFDTLTLALDQAEKIESASKIRNFVRPSKAKTDADTGLEILAAEPASATTNQQNFSQSTDSRHRRNLDPNARGFQPGFPEQAVGRYGNSSNFGVSNTPRQRFNQPGRAGGNRYSNNAGFANRDATKRCWYCNRLGHVSRNCRTRARNEAQNFPQGPSPRQ